MKKISHCAFALAVPLVIATAITADAAYPVSGTWTYDNAREAGPAKNCGKRQMSFRGVMRYDTETSVPSYRNLSVQQINPQTFRVVDQVYNMLATGKLYFTLRLVDSDHISIQFDRTGNVGIGGSGWLLRRCA